MPDDKPTPDPKTCPVEMSDRKSCGRALYYDTSGQDKRPVCLMHSHDTNKPKDEFQQEIDAILEGNSEHHRPDDKYDFRSFVFLKLSHFSATLDKDAIFREATFTESASFTAVTFTRDADFGWATFTKRADFSWATFAKYADFSRTTFTQTGYFFRATFAQNANFSHATFTQKVDFRDTTFTQKADFHWVTFKQDADFRAATLEQEALFRSTWFLQLAKFRYAKFLEPKKVSFRQVNQTRRYNRGTEQEQSMPCKPGLRVYFSDCNVEEVVFEDVNWQTHGDRMVLQDEFGIPKEIDNHELVAIAYRRLTNNFQKARQYDLAEDCFVGAMEMKRLDPKQPWGARFVTTLYKFASEYGSNYIRALAVLFGLVGFFGLLYAIPFFGLMPVKTSAALERLDLQGVWYGLQRIGDGVLYAFEVATFQRQPTFEVTNVWGKIVRMLETVLIPGQIALLFLALRRRFRR